MVYLVQRDYPLPLANTFLYYLFAIQCNNHSITTQEQAHRVVSEYFCYALLTDYRTCQAFSHLAKFSVRVARTSELHLAPGCTSTFSTFYAIATYCFLTSRLHPYPFLLPAPYINTHYVVSSFLLSPALSNATAISLSIPCSHPSTRTCAGMKTSAV